MARAARGAIPGSAGVCGEDELLARLRVQARPSVLQDGAVRMSKTEIIVFLWNLLDDIDTLDDACKSDDHAFRNMTRNAQRRRFETGIKTDGYSLTLGSEVLEP